MGILSSLMGHASEADVAHVERDLEQILADNERVEQAYNIFRDLFVFTSKRLILVDKQGITGKKVRYDSIPYGSIVRFSVESAGHFDMDSELSIWVRDMVDPIHKEFKRGDAIVGVQKSLAQYALR